MKEDRRVLIVLCFGLVALTAGTLVAMQFSGKDAFSTTRLLRMGLTTGLAFCLYFRMNWARILTIILTGLAFPISGLAAIALLLSGEQPLAVTLWTPVLAVGQFTVFISLLFCWPIKKHFVKK